MSNTKFDDVGLELKLEIRDFEQNEEDIIFYKVYDKTGNNLSVNCTGCRNSTNESVMDSTTPTIPTTTVVNSTPEGPAPTDSTCTNQSNDVGNVYVITLGVILAAVILLTIVGIAIYCVLSWSRSVLTFNSICKSVEIPFVAVRCFKMDDYFDDLDELGEINRVIPNNRHQGSPGPLNMAFVVII
ncbi:hypothetical protein LOTGIDRAFT_175570 [Lottia gigantea]|uniref:Uncharacterized protein n=1 Tax=Lottia gigantea TaxID=225164 RepID=V4BWN9_LOTGI|nr:hypothetical protein LOTGIDRAFT_175570 [Lottia gigantea]ESO93424.1 hypothetical protein LOTGIDRAFT_175570 [Lottia gigantea]